MEGTGGDDEVSTPEGQSQLQPQHENPATVSDNGKIIQYIASGHIFELTAKYKPPIMALGKGISGIVFSAVDSETNEKVAIKKISDAFDIQRDALRTLREIRLLRHLMNHDNIVQIKDVIPPPQRHSFNDVYIVYERMDIDLHQIIQSGQPLTEEHYQYLLYQILRGLKYIHSANVLHRDLKPSNLLVNGNCDLKICDFGMACANAESIFKTGYVVTRWYRAPELLFLSSDYTAAIDVWAVGCIFMELMNRKALFRGKDTMDQLRSILKIIGTPPDADFEHFGEFAEGCISELPVYEGKPFSELFPHVHPQAIDLVQKMLTFDPRKRITVEDALAHPYLDSLHDVTEEPACPSIFNSEFEEHVSSVEEIRELIYQEALAFNPQFEEK